MTCTLITPARRAHGRQFAALQRRSRHRAVALAAAALFGPWAAAPAAALTCNWLPSGGNWGTAALWSCGVVPTGPNVDTANIGLGQQVNIDNLDGSSNFRSIYTLNQGGTLVLDAFGLSLQSGGSTTNTGTILVGGPVTAALQVGNGHQINNAGGVISVANGSVLNLFGSGLAGGTVNTLGSGAVVAFSSGSNVLSNVALNGVLDVATNVNARERIGAGMVLNGAVNIGNGGILSLDSTLAAANSISGTGTFHLNDSGARLAIEGSGTTTLGANILVRGQGNVGIPLLAGGNNELVNLGRISADIAGGTLSLSTPASGGSSKVTNQGVLEARAGGNLQLASFIDNSAGQISALDGSTVVQTGIMVQGGTLVTSGSGRFLSNSSSANFLSGVTLNGVLDMTSIAIARNRVVNGATVNGQVNIAGGGILSLDSSATAGGAQTIAGSGVINLNDPGARLAVEGSGSTTLAAGLTVRGQGNIGTAVLVGGNNTLTNNGLISADVTGATLSITPPANGGGSVFVNNGTLQAVNGATLLLATAITANPGSQILAGTGSAVVQGGVRITGVINSSGSGVFSANSSGSNFLDGVAFNGTLDLTSIAISRERIVNGATFNGAVQIANGGILSLDSSATAGGAQTLGGAAVINLNDANARLSVEGTGSTTLGAGVTVRGQGNIGTAVLVGGNNVLTNQGLISADVAGGTLNIAAPANGGGSSFVNAGTLQAVGGGTLLLSTHILANAGSQIVAGAGSAVVQNGVRITGVINVSGSGSFRASSSGANFLDGVSFVGALDVTSIANARERFINGATLNGSVEIGNGGFVSLDSASTAGGSQLIGGNGTFKLNDASARLTVEGTGSTTLGSGVVVRGQGNFGTAVIVGGNNVLTNNGLVLADVNGGILDITTPASGGASQFINNGSLQASGGGVLRLSTAISNTGAGFINAQNGSTVLQSGARVSGGVIGSAGSGSFAVSSNGANFLDGVTLNGKLDLTTIANGRERIVNGAVINGRIDVGNGGFLSLDSTATAGGAQTLSGTGVIHLNDSSARLTVEGAGSTTLAAGLTVRGQGNIGTATFAGGNNTLFNHGLILADGGTLTLNAPASGGASALLGTGTLQTSGGTLNLATGNHSTQGRLVMGGAGSAFNLNNRNLTLLSDYTNAQWGSGDSFNRRAGITGTGLLLAGGDVAQAITGAQISNGNTANATLTIGNVRVGSTTFNYQIANTGSNGPTLRGAIQTSVNGGNLSDARLSGAGVTAGNYSAGAPGGSSGNQGVSFSVASAGAIAPLTGQVLNLRSNFENIADQKLNLAVGAGAAAYNAAVGLATPSPVMLAAQRVGGGLTAALVVANTAPAGAFSEDLNASFSAATGAAFGSGSRSGVVAGTSNTGSGAMSVGVDTSVSGVRTGTVTIGYATAGTVGGVSNGLGVTAVDGQTLNLSGKVYAPAVAQLNTPAVNFGIVRVGDAVAARNVSVSNTASGALTDTLRATLSGGGAPYTASGTAAAVAAGGSNSSSLNVALNTSVAGIYVGSPATVTFTSQNPDMSDLALGTAAVALSAQVNNLAGTTLAHGGAGSFSGGLLSYTLNFGSLQAGQAGGTATLSLSNSATGPADALAGSFDLSSLMVGDPFALGGFGSFAGLAAGDSLGGLTVSFGGLVEGSFDRVLLLNRLSTNGSGPDLTLSAVELRLVGSVTAVPEPGTWALWLGGLAALGGLLRRRSRRD